MERRGYNTGQSRTPGGRILDGREERETMIRSGNVSANVVVLYIRVSGGLSAQEANRCGQ